VNVLQPIIYLAIGLLIGLIMAKITAKKSKDSKSPSKDYPEWHTLGEVFDKHINLGDRVVIKFIDSDSEQTKLILKVYDKRAHSRDMLFTATFYCVQDSSSKFKVSPGNYICQEGAHESFHLAEFKWTDQGIVMVHRRRS
jgi:hypothetical protein